MFEHCILKHLLSTVEQQLSKCKHASLVTGRPKLYFDKSSDIYMFPMSVFARDGCRVAFHLSLALVHSSHQALYMYTPIHCLKTVPIHENKLF